MSRTLFAALRRSRIAGAALAMLAVWAGAATEARAFDLSVEITGARSSQGRVAAALYSDAAGWLKLPAWQALQAPAGEKTVLVFRNLPAGVYALSALHDENGNGQLDTNAVGLPLEPYGFSRGARGAFGPPAFEAAAFELAADQLITVALR